MEAGVPFVAIDIPHPAATYFGANNYQAGLMRGHYLGRWAKRYWAGEADEVLLIELHRAGSLPKARMRGMSAGIAEVIRLSERCRTISIDGDGQFQTALERVRKHLRESRAKRVLVGVANDSSAAGRAARFPGGRSRLGMRDREAQRGAGSAGGIEDAEYETDRFGGVFPGEVWRWLDSAGARYISARWAVPPAVFTGDQVITPDNVDHHYPNDSLLAMPAV